MNRGHSEWKEALAANLAECLPWSTVLWSEREGRVIEVPTSQLVPTRLRLKYHSGWQRSILSDRTAEDRIWKSEADGCRYQRRYSLLSLRYSERLRVVCLVDEGDKVPTRTGIWPVANWREREVFDRFGVRFDGHPDRRRILTDYGFEGHPLRKDFPLTGYTEVRYDEGYKRVVQEPVQLAQERRDFDFETPWGAPDGNRYQLGTKGE